MPLLIVEDDGRWGRYLVRGLSESGHVADWVADGDAGLALALEGIYDALIAGCRAWTASRWCSNRANRVAGLRAGCDDYLAKPYAFAEVLARVEGLARGGPTRRAANRCCGSPT